jgi:hypothetical protein
MRTTSKFLALALTAAAQSAMAGTIPLNFEDLSATAALGGNYNGVNVSGNAWGAVSIDCTDGDVRFTRPQSCGALWLAVDAEKPQTGRTASLTMSIAEGFDALSFIYSGSSSTINLSVSVFDADGKQLTVWNQPKGVACDSKTYLFCEWSPTKNLQFSGIARSVIFSGLDQNVLLDDIVFNTPASTGQLPEPTSIALTLGALGGLAWSRKRKAS